MNMHFRLTGLFVVLATGLCLAQSERPSLADLARQSHSDKKPVRVFTEDDLPATPSSGTTVAADDQNAASAGAAQSDPSKKDPENADKPTDKKAHDTTKKENATSELKKKLDRYTAERDGWKQSVKRYEDLLANDPDPFRRQTYEEALSIDRQNVATFQARIDETQSALAKAQKESEKDGATAEHTTAATNDGQQ